MHTIIAEVLFYRGVAIHARWWRSQVLIFQCRLTDVGCHGECEENVAVVVYTAEEGMMGME